MKGTVIVLGTTLIAAVVASIESPAPDGPKKPEANANTDLRRPAVSPANDNKSPEPTYAAVKRTNIDRPTITPTATAIPERIPKK